MVWQKISDKHNTTPLFLQRCRLMNKPLLFNYLKELEWNIYENKYDELVIAILQGSDGKVDHCVTLYGHWIFDSNVSNALTLNKKV